jgi:hypothetical protein
LGSGDDARDTLGSIGSGKISAIFAVRCDVFEGLVAIPPVEEVGCGDSFSSVSLEVTLKNQDNSIGLRVGKRAEQHSVYYTEDHAVRSDAKS